jgi:hypothetical protein
VEGRLQSRKAPRCRACDAFLPERDWRGKSDEKVRCPKCDHEGRPYTETMVDVRADRVTLLGGGGARTGVASERGDSAGGPSATPEVVDPLTDDDIPF